MKRLLLSVLAFLFIFTAQEVWAQKDYSDVEIKVTHVYGAVYMLEGAGGNIGVSVGTDGLLIIDDQFAPLAEKITAALEGLNSGELKFVLNTHWHGDHTGGNEIFGKEATIIAHDNVRKRLSSRQEVKMFNMVSEPKPTEALPVITFGESLSIHFNNEEIKVIHFANGHTDGDSVIHFTKSNVFHLGDHFFSGRYPFIDLGSGGDVEGFMHNVGNLLEMIPADAKIIPGHGPLSDVNDLRAFHKMLVQTTGIVRDAIAQGKSLEKIQAEGFPEEIEEKWGKGFLNSDKWIMIIYNSLMNS